MNEEILANLRALKGSVSTVVLGQVEESFSHALSNMRSWNDRNGFHSVEYVNVPATLVEVGRDAVIEHALRESYDFALQIDADAAPFAPDLLVQMLWTAFIARPDADVVGAYCQLKGSYAPTIDTGTGTWEIHYPGEGILPVIRTGAHAILVKPAICRRFGPPWFRVRRTMRAIDALAEVDNYARIKHDGRNDLVGTDTWRALVEAARSEAGGAVSSVGEDSGFCDAVKACGGNIYVNTDIWVGHVERRVIVPEMLDEEMEKRENKLRALVGIYA